METQVLAFKQPIKLGCVLIYPLLTEFFLNTLHITTEKWLTLYSIYNKSFSIVSLKLAKSISLIKHGD